MLTLAQKASLLETAHHALAALFAEAPLPRSTEVAQFYLDTDYCGVFVSLYVNGELRGCIGNLNAKAPLPELIAEMAQAAARHDPRFAPLQAEELSNVAIEISLLHSMQALHAPHEIEIGRDGLFVRRGKKHGLLLPQVAVRRNWGAMQFLEQTCRKADLPLSAWQESATEVFRFAAEVFSDNEEATTES